MTVTAVWEGLPITFEAEFERGSKGDRFQPDDPAGWVADTSSIYVGDLDAFVALEAGTLARLIAFVESYWVAE